MSAVTAAAYIQILFIWRTCLACGYHRHMNIGDRTRARASNITADYDSLILVDASDHNVGSLSKERCHAGRGILHRAFSLLIFNADGDLLIQQRAPSKRLWPHYWSNSCCSHPRSGESLDVATHRRLYEELGLACDLAFLFKFEYQAQFDATGAEHELCSVFVGRCDDPVRVNNDEISAWRWISPERLEMELSAHGGSKYTPWFIMEWERIWREHRPVVLGLQSQN
jgi:isopentenyl-diphosphate delta-isomerase